MVEELRSEPVPTDIEAAVAVTRERNTDHDKPKEGQYLLDLSNAYIFNANFIHTSLKKVNFSDSVMVNCTFNGIDLSESNFVEANLNGSTVAASNLKGARITTFRYPGHSHALKRMD